MVARVKRLPHGVYRRYVILGEKSQQLLLNQHDAPHPIRVLLAVGNVLEGATEVIERVQQILQNTGLDPPGLLLTLAILPLAVITEFRHAAEILVLVVVCLRLQRFDLLLPFHAVLKLTLLALSGPRLGVRPSIGGATANDALLTGPVASGLVHITDPFPVDTLYARVASIMRTGRTGPRPCYPALARRSARWTLPEHRADGSARSHPARRWPARECRKGTVPN